MRRATEQAAQLGVIRVRDYQLRITPVQGVCGVPARVCADILQRRFLQMSFVVARDGA